MEDDIARAERKRIHFERAYVQAMLKEYGPTLREEHFAETGVVKDFTIADFTKEALTRVSMDCVAFMSQARVGVGGALLWELRQQPIYAGRDRFPPLLLALGADGMLRFEIRVPHVVIVPTDKEYSVTGPFRDRLVAKRWALAAWAPGTSADDEYIIAPINAPADSWD